MADYPSLPVDEGSQIQKDGGIRIDVAQNGAVRGRRLYAQTVFRITLVHRYISNSDRTTLLSHYDSHAGQRFNWTSPAGELYGVQYLDEPAEIQHPTGDWTMTTRLIGTRA